MNFLTWLWIFDQLAPPPPRLRRTEHKSEVCFFREKKIERQTRADNRYHRAEGYRGENLFTANSRHSDAV